MNMLAATLGLHNFIICEKCMFRLHPLVYSLKE